jgi:hypothetical protein
VSPSRRRMLRLATAVTLAGAAALLPATALRAEAPRPPLPDSVRQALQALASLGFEDMVAVYHDLRPTIEMQPAGVLAFGGITEGWAMSPHRNASIRLRADLQGCLPMLTAILAHELLHVWQFAYDPEVYGNCLPREVAAYRLEASVLRAWCTANPSEQYGLSGYCMNLMSVAEQNYPETLESFAGKESCGIH